MKTKQVIELSKKETALKGAIKGITKRARNLAPKSPRQRKIARDVLVNEDSEEQEAAASKAKRKAAVGAQRKSKQGVKRARRTAEQIARDEAAAAAKKAKEQQAADILATMEARTAAGKAARDHHKAELAASESARNAAFESRIQFCIHVIKLTPAEAKTAHRIMRVSGSGVTIPRFKEGANFLAEAKGMKPDKHGNYDKTDAKGWQECRSVYNRMEATLRALAIESAKASKHEQTKVRLGASPATKPSKTGKVRERKATMTQTMLLDLDTLRKAGSKKLDGYAALLRVADTSNKVLDSAAARLCASPTAFVAAASKNNAMPSWQRHCGNIRKGGAKVMDYITNKDLIGQIQDKGKTAQTAKELYESILAAAQTAANTVVATKATLRAGRKVA